MSRFRRDEVGRIPNGRLGQTSLSFCALQSTNSPRRGVGVQLPDKLLSLWPEASYTNQAKVEHMSMNGHTVDLDSSVNITEADVGSQRDERLCHKSTKQYVPSVGPCVGRYYSASR